MTTHGPIGCQEAVASLWEMVDGRLDELDQQRLDRHLAWCLRCCGELAFARELRGMLRDRSGVAVPHDVRRRLESVIDGLATPAGGEVPG
jgi:anti-sigma factor (TIGR02949 family)